MKKFTLITFISMMLLGGVSYGQKIGHIDVQALLEAMPAKIKADTEIKALYDRHQQEIEKQEKAIEDFIAKVDAETKGKSQEQLQQMQASLEQKGKEFQAMQDKIKQYQQAATQEVQQKSETLFTPVNKQAQDAINAVAARKNLEYVIDAAVLLYSNGGYNMLNDIKQELGIK